MGSGQALVLTIMVFAIGIAICTYAVQTPEGQALLNLLNIIAFILGFIYMILGFQQGNMMRVGFGILLIITAVGGPTEPNPLVVGFQLFCAIGGAFIPAP